MTYENFTTFTEQDDTGDHIQVATATHVDYKAYRNDKAILYKDYGASHFGTVWEHKLNIKFVTYDTTFRPFVHCLANDLLPWVDLLNGNKPAIALDLILSGGACRLYINELYNGVQNQSPTYFVMTVGTMYYLMVKRDGTAFTCKVYLTDSDRTNDTNCLAALSVTLNVNHPSHQYMLLCDDMHYLTDAYWGDWDIENLDLQEGGNNYERELSDIIGDLEVRIQSVNINKIDIIGEVESKFRGISRIFSDMIGEAETRIKNMSKFLSEHIGEVEVKVKNITKFLSDKIGSLESKVRTVNLHRVFSDIIGDKDILRFARIIERTLTEIIGMVDTHTGIRHYIRVFLEKTGMKHKYSNLKNWYTYWHKERPRQRVSSE